MRRAMLVVVAFGVMLAALQGTAVANDSFVGGVAGALAPLADADVRMEAETIQAIVYDNYAHYRVDFKFVNTGVAKTLKLGFPFQTPSTEWNELGAVAGFQAWVDGSRIPVAYETGTDGSIKVGYYTHSVTFKRGTTMVRVEYLADTSGTSVGGGDLVKRPAWHTGGYDYTNWYPYWVHTGAGWRGTIGRTVIRFRLADDCSGFDPARATLEMAHRDEKATNVPGFVTLDDRTVQWCYTDYEPTRDKEYTWSPYDVHFGIYKAAYPHDEDAPVQVLRTLVKDEDCSSFLTLGEYEYPARNAFSRVADAWAEGVEGPGSGQWVSASYGAPRDVEEIRVVSGYAKRPDLFAKYNRPKTLRVTFSDGRVRTFELNDTAELQRFAVPKTTTDSIKVEIVDVYPGTTRDETYLSLVDVGAHSPSFEAFEKVLASGVVVPGAQPEMTSTGTETPSATTAPGMTSTGPTAPAASVWPAWARLLAPLMVFMAPMLVIAVIVVRRRLRAQREALVAATEPPAMPPV